ncbi:alcohol dehydrogenase catalytic domain-containing protein [Streptomyces longispororuber]|uniref:alcohol dehydrogenase catalytic domain-containing protein n=1 Tax=Streptomyces longispororuber TaxID=68230 RepID=UPI00210E6C5F|nr:alcohol dehydrogenase catalytic domain-containing protein [Streptomyces longispororuber]MCQ4211818.1 alcohol dehydrogenase catalytic domain-containing protein [Streptomyces longispororuber]
MRTSVLLSRGAGPTAVVEAELDDPRAHEVVVRIEAVGVCHTDLVTRKALGDRPAVLGHEGCGIVERTGTAVDTLAVGERVVISFASCGRCGQCRAGHPAYCDLASALNASGRRLDGTATIRVDDVPVFGAHFGQSSFAAAALADARSCVPVGDTPPEVAAPLGCGFLTGAGAVLNVLRPGPGDRLLVVGAGAVGTAAVLTALSDGVEVVVAEPVAARRELAVRFGALAVASLDDPVPSVTHALDTTGRPEAITRALALLRPRGALAVVGLGPATAGIDVRDLMLRGLHLRGCVEGDAEPSLLVPELIRRHVEGRLPLDALVTTYPLDDFDRAVTDQRAGLTLKPVLIPPG